MASKASSRNRLLTTLAILLAHYDNAKDFLSNFEPFLVDLLKGWPAGEEARPKKLAKQLSEKYCLPDIPLNTVTELRDRARAKHFLVVDSASRCFPNPQTLADIAGLNAGRTEFLDHFEELAEAIVSYAWSVHNRAWTNEEAEAALERFIEDFSIELAMAMREGGMDGDHPTLSRSEALAVVHGFARRALEQDERKILTYLEEVVQASMLANLIYLQNLGGWRSDFGNLTVYLDTTVAFRVLGLTDEEVSEAAREMNGLLREFSVPVRVFDHTLVEMQGVLERVQRDLRENAKGRTNLDQLMLQRQEVLVHSLRQGLGPADVQEIVVGLRERLAEHGIAIAATPEPTAKLSLDRRRLDEILLQIGFKDEAQRMRDIQSLSAIQVLREGRPFAELGDARAIFVTSNDRLVKASKFWFLESGKESIVSQCTSETSFTTQLWLRKPQGAPDVARKFLIAESFAALNPTPELWERYLDRIAQRRDRREITEEQVKALVFSTEAKEGLVEVAHGDPERVDDEAIAEVLARSEGRAPDGFSQQLEDARRDIASLHEESAAISNELEAQENTVATQSDEIEHLREMLQEVRVENLHRMQREDEAAHRRSVLRRFGGSAIASALVFSTILLWKSSAVTGAVPKAGVGFGGLCGATMVAAWSHRKDCKWAIAMIAAVGAFTAVFFGLLSLADHETPSGQPPHSTSSRVP